MTWLLLTEAAIPIALGLVAGMEIELDRYSD